MVGKYKWTILCGILLCIFTVVYAANKTIIQVPVTIAEVDSLQIRRDSADESGNTLECVVGYRVKTDSGVVIGLNRSIKIPLTAAQQTTLRNFVLNTVVPAVNSQEGT